VKKRNFLLRAIWKSSKNKKKRLAASAFRDSLSDWEEKAGAFPDCFSSLLDRPKFIELTTAIIPRREVI
jgi:hypothetical protein